MATIDVNAAVLYYEERGCGPPLLLVHGTGGYADVWSPVLDGLARFDRVDDLVGDILPMEEPAAHRPAGNELHLDPNAAPPEAKLAALLARDLRFRRTSTSLRRYPTAAPPMSSGLPPA